MRTTIILDICRRKSILAESSEISSTVNISNAYERAKSDRYEDIRYFIKECGKNRFNANEYLTVCIEFVEANNTSEIMSIFKKEVLPRVNDYELNYAYETHRNSPVAEAIHEQIVSNKVIDRIVSNHRNIMKSFNVERLFEDARYDSNTKISTLCQVIDSFQDIPVYAKVNIALEESEYLLERFLNEDYDYLRDIIKYYCTSHDLTTSDIRQISEAVKTNHVLVEFEDSIKSGENNFKVIIDKYISRPGEDHNPYELEILHNRLLNTSLADWCNNISCYLELLRDIYLYSEKEEIREYTIQYIKDKFIKDFTETFEVYPEYKARLKALINAINKVEESVLQKEKAIDNNHNFDEMIDRCAELSRVLDLIGDRLSYTYDITYTAENVNYMNSKTVFNESTVYDRMTLYEFKDRKFDPLIVKFGKFDKMLQKEIRGWVSEKKKKIGDSIHNAMKAIEDKMYEESSIYDMIVNDHIDYVIDSYYFDPETENMEKLHNRCTTLIEKFNNEELKDTSMIAYYTLETNCINFHIKDNTTILLDEDESILANEMIDTKDLDDLSNSLFISECIDENFDLFEQATEFFINNPTEGYFETFCDACSMAGVMRETVEDIYDYVKVRTNSGFVSQNSYYINSYKEQTDVDIYTQAESWLALQAMLEDTKPIKKENKPEPTKSNSRVKVKVTPTTKTTKTTPTTKNTKEVDNSKMSKTTDTKGVENPLKGINLNNLKLYIAGLRKNVKDLDSKTRTLVRNMDATVEHLIKSMKGALISDRRESIIKGSIIPSFHKCILIAVGLAGLAWFNAPLAVITAIGGFAASKKLTERERALMLDDIEIELELLEKEIQMADSRNQIKKMRQLMKMKKNLQREYQRIKYNIRIGKDIIPSGSYLPSKD